MINNISFHQLSELVITVVLGKAGIISVLECLTNTLSLLNA